MYYQARQNMEDDTLDLLREFLPQIQAELRAQIQPQLQQEMQKIATQQIQLIETQAQQEYEQALADLSIKFTQIENEKKIVLNQQITALQAQFEEQEAAKLTTAHEQLMFEKFDTDIMNHPKFQQVAATMEEEITELMIQKYYANRSRKEKELKVRIENKAHRERVQIDDTIRKEVTAKSGLAEVREELKHLRVEVASEKSKCNVRIKNIINETNQIKNKIKQQNETQLLNIKSQLQAEIQKLKQQMMSSAYMQTAQEVSQMMYQHLQRPHKQIAQEFSLDRGKTQHQYINEDFSFDSSHITESQQNIQQSETSNSQIPEPPENNINQYYFQKQIIQKQQAVGPLLKFNVKKMIECEWQDDEFDRFMRNEVNKENSSNNRIIQQKSNFCSLYQLHLQNLNNRNKVKGKVKLSQRAKEQLLHNWQQNRHKIN